MKRKDAWKRNATEHAEHSAKIAKIEHSSSSFALDVEGLFEAACAHATPEQQSLLQQVRTLGHYPKRCKDPRDKAEALSNSLAKKLAQSQLPEAAQAYLSALKKDRIAKDLA